eukprot:12496056-Heterocapsa_arctica.AAC.1
MSCPETVRRRSAKAERSASFLICSQPGHRGQRAHLVMPACHTVCLFSTGRRRMLADLLQESNFLQSLKWPNLELVNGARNPEGFTGPKIQCDCAVS